MLPQKIRSFLLPALLLLLLFLSILLLANSLIQRPSVQRFFISRISDAIGFDIYTDRIELNLWRGIGIFVHGLEARSRQGPESIVASRVRIVLDEGELIKGHIVPVSLYLYEPKIELDIKDARDSSRPRQGPPVRGPLPFWIPGLQSISVERGQARIIGSPFDLKDLFFDIHQTGPEPMTLRLSSKGRVGFKGEWAPFGLRGTISRPRSEARFPFADVMLETDRVPLEWISWPESIPVKGGDFRTHLKIKGNLDGPLAVNGEIVIDSFHFFILQHDREKEYSLSKMTLDFRSVIEGERVKVPFLRLTAPDVSLDIALELDLKEGPNPYLQLTAKGPDMPLHAFKRIFPSPLLPPWVEDRLFPLLNKGDIQLKLLSIEGRADQFRALHLPVNRSTLALRLACKDLEVSGNGFGPPFRDISAEVILENGDLLISRLRADFGRSTIREVMVGIKGIFSGSPSFETVLDGSFDLRELMLKKDMDLIPPDVRQQLGRVESFSGRLDLMARFHYEYDWKLPRITKAEFIFRECALKQKELIFTLVLREAQIHIDRDNQNRFRGIGSWGNSRFELTGSFGDIEKGLHIQRADISAGVDMNEVIPLFYHGDKLPLEFDGPVTCQISMTGANPLWSFRGRVDLDGVVLGTDEFYIDPPGGGERIVFELDYRPRERIELKKVLCEFGGSPLEISGNYDLKSHDIYTLRAFSPGLSLADLGIRFKKRSTRARGILSGQVRIRSSRQNPLMTSIRGGIEGKDLFFDSGWLPSPINECHFRLDFTGKRASIAFWEMRIGESRIHISGDLRGWKGLKGEIQVDSDFLDVADILPHGDDSHLRDKGSDRNGLMDNWDIRMNLDILRGQWRRLKWGPLKAELALREGDFYIRRSKVSIDHALLKVKGHVKKGMDPELLFSSHIQMTDQPVEDLLEGIGMEDGYLKGSLTMEALLFMKGKQKKDLIQSLTGVANVLIKRGTIRESHVIIRVLDFLSLQKVFRHKPPGHYKEGFYFESISWHNEIQEGVVKTENLVMKGPVFNAVASGEVDMSKRRVDFDLGIQPLETVDILVSKIPILGYILTGKKKSLLTYYFKVDGPLSGPEVRHVPLRSLGNGVAGALKRLFLTPVRLFEDLSGAARRIFLGRVLPDTRSNFGIIRGKGLFRCEREG